MKTIITFLLFALFSLNLIAAETLSFKFSNPRIAYNSTTGINSLRFDIFVKATSNGSYLYGSQIIFNVNYLNFNTAVNPTFTLGPLFSGNYYNPDLEVTYAMYNNPVICNWASNNLNIAIIPNISSNGQLPSSGAYTEVTTTWQLLGTVSARIVNVSGIAGISFQSVAMDGYQTFATGIGPTYSDKYASPNNYEGYDLTDLYLARIFSGSSWSQVGGTVSWLSSVNTSVWDGTANLATANASADNLRIHEAASLAINQPASLTVSGTLTNASTSGNNGLVIKSDATGTGSLIHNNTGVNATVERYIAPWTAPEDGWHLLSSPVTAQPITGSWTPATATSYDFYVFDETIMGPYEYWLNQKIPANNITSFIPGKGYLVAYEATDTKQFTGELNTASQTVSLTNTPGTDFQGWNLVGNPFPSAINWNGGSWAGTNVDAIAQVWNENNSSYTQVGFNPYYYDAGIIPAMNGFMVHATAATTQLIPASARVHDATNWLKSSEEEYLYLVAKDLEGSTSQSSIVRFNPEATDGYDTKFDSYFLKGYAPQFYSVAGNESYALNTLPEMKDFLEIPFAFVKNGSGSFSIELAKNLPDAIVYLIDKKTDTKQNLSENPVYAFTAAEGDQTDRFILHFGSQFLGLNPSNANANFSVWYNRGDIRFSTLPEKVLSMSLIDMAGRELVNLGKPLSDKVSVGKKLTTGYYLLRIRMADKVVVKKLFINEL